MTDNVPWDYSNWRQEFKEFNEIVKEGFEHKEENIKKYEN